MFILRVKLNKEGGDSKFNRDHFQDGMKKPDKDPFNFDESASNSNIINYVSIEQ